MHIKFKSITANKNDLYALGEDGIVYIYKVATPSTAFKFSFWSRLTSYTPEPEDRKKVDTNKSRSHS